jgi:hypothetical protein
MKILVNGGVNLSALDGWWQEAYRPEVGWGLPHDGADDDRDATRLYELLEREVVPAFYERDPSGLPRAWIARMRESMPTLTPTYSANRALREYAERYYVPAARALAKPHRERRSERGAARRMGPRRKGTLAGRALRRGTRSNRCEHAQVCRDVVHRRPRPRGCRHRAMHGRRRSNGGATHSNATRGSARGLPRLRIRGRGACSETRRALHAAGRAVPSRRVRSAGIAACDMGPMS